MCYAFFSFHLVPLMGDLFARKSGLCQMGICELGDIVKFVILLTFHQADRVVAITLFLK